jgi:hypothetical protein
MALIARQGLIAVGTIKFKFVRVHWFQLYMRDPAMKSMEKNMHTFPPAIALVRSDEES